MALNDTQLDDILGSPDEAKPQDFDKASLFRAAEGNPVAAGEAQRIAPALGAPVPAVQSNLDQARIDHKVQAISKVFGDTPELGELRSDEQFVDVAYDQPQEISAFKAALIGFNNPAGGGIAGAVSSAISGALMASPAVRQTATNLSSAANTLTGGVLTTGGVLADRLVKAGPIGALNQAYEQALEAQKKAKPEDSAAIDAELARVRDLDANTWPMQVARAGQGIMESANIDMKPLAPWDDVRSAKGVGDTAGALGSFLAEQTVLSAPETLLSLFAAPLVAASYVGQVASARSQRKGEKDVTLQDVGEAGPAGVVIGMLDKYGADRVLGAIDRLQSSAWRRTVTAGVSEGVTQVAQNELQYVAERQGIDPLDLKEMVDMIPASLIGAAGAGAGLHALHESAHTVAEHVVKSRADAADQGKSLLDQLSQLAEASEIKKRNPEQLNRMVEKLAPGTELFIDAEHARDALFQSGTELPTDIEQRIDEALEANTPVRFTPAEYATYLSPVADKINDKIRVGSPDALNAEEAKSIDAEFSARAEQTVATADNAAQLVGEGEAIRANVQAQITSTGRSAAMWQMPTRRSCATSTRRPRHAPACRPRSCTRSIRCASRPRLPLAKHSISRSMKRSCNPLPRVRRTPVLCHRATPVSATSVTSMCLSWIQRSRAPGSRARSACARRRVPTSSPHMQMARRPSRRKPAPAMSSTRSTSRRRSSTTSTPIRPGCWHWATTPRTRRASRSRG